MSQPRQGQPPGQPPEESCQHMNCFLNAVGYRDNENFTMTVYEHWRCPDCNAGWTDEYQISDDEYNRRQFED